jgi:flagellar biosynthesis chaperone FliJ
MRHPISKGSDMNKRMTLLATVSAAALLGAGSARAQLAVIDGANLANTAQQVTQLTAQLKNMEQQLATAQQTFATLSHGVSDPLQAASSQLDVPALRNVLPTGSGALGSIVTGTGLGNTGSLGTQNFNANHVYTPTGTDFNATRMATNANSIAGVQAASQELYQSATSHMVYMNDLESQLDSSPDQKTTADLQARIAQEQTYLQAQQVQASTLQTLQAAQVRNVEQQGEEKDRQNVDDVLAQDATTTPGS